MSDKDQPISGAEALKRALDARADATHDPAPAEEIVADQDREEFLEKLVFDPAADLRDEL